ncbi:MAG: DUF732 domain-containing protein [Mycobacteriaceae bacterium]|nr:DUF732 domain-containing protein [Mycobacteriaceae bacterium]
MPTFRHLTAAIAAAAAASLGIAALVGAGMAGATTTTDDMFVSVLTDEGIQPPSTEEAVSLAYDVCVMFDQGQSLYDAVGSVSDTTDLTTEDSAFFVGAAVATYCPEHDAELG